HLDLADTFLYQGKYREALEEAEKAIALSPGTALNYLCKGNVYIYQGDLARAAEEFRNLLKLKDPMAQGYHLYEAITLAILQGKFKEAGALAGRAVQALEKLNAKEIANGFRLLSAYSLWKSGHAAESVQEYKKILDIAKAIDSTNWTRVALHRKGLAYCALNLPEEARRTAEELSVLVKQGLNQKEMARVDHLLGAIELQKGNTRAAIDYLRKAVSQLPHEYSFTSDEQAIYFEPLAAACYKSGDLDKAREEYEKIAALTTGRHVFGDIYARSFYWLGRIYEQQGKKAKAAENYRKFLDLWAEADPGRPEVPDANKRLAALSGI
ncbi:MAG TPA: tetratricopeptide repeat protein, partial [Acidobacteriota bacterium]